MKLAKTLVIPYLKRFWLMLISVVLVGAFGVGILIGLRNAYLTLNKEVNNFLDNYHYPDISVGLTSDFDYSLTNNITKEQYDEYNIDDIIYRKTFNTAFKNKKGKDFNGRVFSYQEDDFLKFYHYNKNDNIIGGLKLEYNFAKTNHFKVGDEMIINMPNGENVKYNVSAIICSPETSVVSQDSYSLSSARDFAYIYLPRDEINKYTDEVVFNEILVKFKDGKKRAIKDILEELQESGIDVNDYVKFAFDYDTSNVIKQYNTSLRAVNYISLGAPLLFFVIVLIVTALFLSQIIRQCRKDIGIMRALGEKKSDIVNVFLILTLVVSIISWLIGLGLGSIITLIANKAYGEALRLYPLPFRLNPLVIIISFIALVGISELTAFLVCISISKIKPVEAMKALPPSNNNAPYLVRTIFKNSPISFKVSLSQNLRNLKRYIISGVCILASGIMILVSLSLGESKKAILNQLFETRMNYNVQVYLNDMPDDEEEFINNNFKDIDGNLDSNIKDMTLIKYSAFKFENGNKEIIGLVNGVKSDQKLLYVVDNYDKKISIPNEGIVLSNHFAKKLGANVGDTIIVNGVEIKVSKISNEFIYQVNYISYDNFDTIAGTSKYQGSLLVNAKNENKFFSKYSSVEEIDYIAFNSVIKAEYSDRFIAFDISAAVLTGIALIMGFMIVFNMIQTNLKEQKRTFATMRTLGYQRSSISIANLINNLFQYFVAMIFAIPMGIGIGHILLNSISTSEQTFPYPKTIIIYFLCMLMVLAFLLVSHFVAMHDMKKWNLPSAIKERE